MMIEVKSLSKHYGAVRAVDNVSFKVERGEIVGFLGPNGAGKTTTMKVLTCYLAPTSGTATVDGCDILDDPVGVRSKIGYLPESTPLYEEMGVLEYLNFVARMRGLDAMAGAKRVNHLIDICDISRMAHKDIGELSKGFRQRVGLAQALMHDPPVLILDEPTSGLDPGQIVEIRELIKSIAREKCILLSTHILPEAQNTCNRILIINEGRIAGEGTSDELLAMAVGEERYILALKGGDAKQMGDGLRMLPKVSSVTTLSADGASRFSVVAAKGADLNEAIFDFAVERRYKLLELQHTATSLEDVFLRLTGSTGEGMVLTERLSHAAESADAGAGETKGGSEDE
jgi:ABC-2 type transport system ATP-binding protein